MMYKQSKIKPVYQYDLNGNFIKKWISASECKRNGFNQGAISACCRGERNKHGGYKWSFEPL